MYQRFSDSILSPQLIQLQENLYILAFRIMKLMPAKYIINEAIKRGEITPKSTVVDTSSGTFALGIGIICAEIGLPFRIFSDPAIDQSLLARLQDLGGSVHFSMNAANPGAYQKLRLEALGNYLDQNKLSFWMKQYDNIDNQHSYTKVGEMLLEHLGKHIHIIGTVGSGGSTGGIIRLVRQYNEEIKLIGVDTFNSVLFGLADGKRELRGLGNTIMPKNVDHHHYDEIHWVGANDANYYTRYLHKKYALYMGPTTGAAYQVARWLANNQPKQTYVFIGPDEGYRYQDSTYNDEWLKKQSFYSDNITQQPVLINHPREVRAPWSCIDWNRRSYKEVLGHEYSGS